MARIAVYLILAIASAAALFFVSDPVWVGLLTGVATALLIPIIDMWANHPYGWDILRSSATLRNVDIRISASYLIRVQDRDRFLLIRGSRYPDQFQPVGGVYKFNPSALEQFKKWELQTDAFVPIDDISVDDLRVRIKGRHLVSFLRWFESGRNREVGAFREYFEELAGPYNLSYEEMQNIRFDLRKMHVNKIRYSDYAQSNELLIADVFDLVCDRPHLEKIKKIAEESPTQFRWVSQEQITRLGAKPGEEDQFRIAITASWTL